MAVWSHDGYIEASGLLIFQDLTCGRELSCIQEAEVTAPLQTGCIEDNELFKSGGSHGSYVWL